MRADLHVHSSASDGTEPPAEVMRRAAQAGLDVVALTDHDTVAGHAEARRALAGTLTSLTLLPGMELSCRLGDRSLHLLAYLFDAGRPDLAAELSRIRDDRVLRAQAMVGRLADLGVGISWDQVAAIAGPAVVGRPHIARAMAASGAIASPREAFTRDWIADGGRAYVGRYALDPVHAIRLVRAAGGVAVLAHPRAGRDTLVSDEEIGRLAAAGLAGVEVFHPDHCDAERARLLALAHDLHLVATGGSDDHGSLTGHRIGCETVAADAYDALISRVPARLAPGATVMSVAASIGYGASMVLSSPPAKDVRRVYHEELDAGQRSALLSWLAFTVTFGAVRGITYSIKAGKGPFGNLSVGGEHLHHYMWGIGLVSGVGGVAVHGEDSRRRHPVVAISYGAGLALIVDEFALLLDLKDVYWAKQGRISVDLGVGASALAGTYFAALPLIRALRRRAM